MATNSAQATPVATPTTSGLPSPSPALTQPGDLANTGADGGELAASVGTGVSTLAAGLIALILGIRRGRRA